MFASAWTAVNAATKRLCLGASSSPAFTLPDSHLIALSLSLSLALSLSPLRPLYSFLT